MAFNSIDINALKSSVPEGVTPSHPNDKPNEFFELPKKVLMVDDEIVISGISGRYPESANINEFWNNLMSGQELASVDDRRWPIEYLGTPPRQGKIKNVEKMDYEFFKLSQEDASFMDLQVRHLHETCYEAIMDAGIDPETMKGSKTAVFIGHCYDDTDSAYREDDSKAPAYKQLTASRVSYAFDFKGPVCCTDTACASSFSAFFKAVNVIRSGAADSAVVCGTSIHLRPFTAVAFHNLKMLSDDGRCKCMDANADGYCRSEAVVSVLLQRRSAAKRVYATIVNTRTNTDGWKQEGVTFPSYLAQKKLMVETYSEAGIDPTTLEYMEAHMTGTPAGDPVESAAITAVFCPKEKERPPLLIGCLKSNMGHTEGASGTCAITKACLVFQRKELPPNLYLNTPSPHIEGLTTGVLKPVLERTPFSSNIIGVNSFGFGGCNVHVILKANPKHETEEDRILSNDGLPRIVTFCGRTREGVENAFKYIEETPKDITRGFLSLLNDFSKTTPSSGMYMRGYGILKEGKIVSTAVERVREPKPLWLVFSAIGCQWPGMAKALMPLKPFAESIQASKEVIEKLGYNLDRLILEEHYKLENLVETFFAIVSVQIALVDVMYFLDMVPEGIVGHSIGEIAAGYADGCMDREQAILTAYHVSKVLVEKGTKFGKRGTMAAVGLSWDQMKEKLPEDGSGNVFIGCNNSQDTITLTGEETEVRAMIGKLVDEGHFVREIDSCGIPFHSPLLQNSCEPITDALAQVLTNPKQRSSRWLSTSVPQHRWHEEEFRVLGPTYYSNLIVAPVMFEDVFQYIPKNAVVVEAGPHAMLLSLIKRGLGPDATVIPLMKRDNTKHNLNLLLSSIGSIYCQGINPSIEKLYPKVVYPVPRETASISPLMEGAWDRSKTLYVTKFPDFFNVMKGDQTVAFDLMEQKSQFLAGHCIDGRILFPATGYLWIIWCRLAMSLGLTNYEECAVEFLNVKFHRASMLTRTGTTSFKILLMPSSGHFTITEGGSICVTGIVKKPEDPSTEELASIIQPKEQENPIILGPKEIYKELRVRGYDYGPSFQGLVSTSPDGCHGQIKWLGNWIAFTDSMLQMTILEKKERGLFLPTFIDYMKCDVKTLLNEVKSKKNDIGESVLEAKFDKDINAGCCKGLVVKGLRASPAPRRSPIVPTVESYQFLPFTEKYLMFNEGDQTRMDTYADYCHRMLRIVETNNTNGLREGVEKDERLKILLEGNEERHILAKVLWEVIHARDKDESVFLPKYLAEAVSKVENNLSNDTLITTPLLMETVLRTQLDVVLENIPSKKINVTEVNETDCIIHSTVSEIIESAANVINNYTIFHPEPENVSKQANGLDMSILKSSFSTNAETDLIVLKDASTKFVSCSDPVKGEDEFNFNIYMKSLYNTVKEKTFVLMLFRSEITPIEEYLRSVAQFPPCDNRLRKLEDTISFVTELGFTVVGSKSTAGGVHSLLLVKPSKEPEVDDHVEIQVKVNDYSWVDQLKEHLLVKEKEEKKNYKIWLIAKDSPFNGIIGLVNCIKRELGGDRIRCLFYPNETINPEDFIVHEKKSDESPDNTFEELKVEENKGTNYEAKNESSTKGDNDEEPEDLTKDHEELTKEEASKREKSKDQPSDETSSGQPLQEKENSLLMDDLRRRQFISNVFGGYAHDEPEPSPADDTKVVTKGEENQVEQAKEVIVSNKGHVQPKTEEPKTESAEVKNEVEKKEESVEAKIEDVKEPQLSKEQEQQLAEEKKKRLEDARKERDSLLTDEVKKRDLLINVYKNGEYGTLRHLFVENIECFGESDHAFLDVKTKGDLSSLRWIEGEHKFWPSLPDTAKNPKDILCSVYYAALNFKDIMVATGRIPIDAYPSDFMGTGLIGMEFSGKDQHGNRILAFAPSKAIATTLFIPEMHFLWKVPDHWTMAEAATVPVVYVTIYYALFVRGQLRPGESVLIHAGSGGIGQAAISVCLAKGCTVFTTVGSQAKREFLLKEFPQLSESHIGNSRDTSFEEMVLRETNGRGVDLVLNSLADDKLQASIRCLADYGRFIEIGKYDIILNNPINLSDLGRNKTFHTVCVAHLDFDALVNKSPGALRLCHQLHKVVEDGILNGEIRPLKYTIFEKDQSEEAFRFMATGKHMGKVLIKMRPDDDLNSPAPPLFVNARKQTIFHPLKTYIITGGLGGFGLELADWMLFRGARKIILTSRSGVKTPFQQLQMSRFARIGAEVVVSTHDVSTLEGTEALIKEAERMGEVGGIFHLAMVLKDAALENQTVQSFQEACLCKVQGTIHLDYFSRKMCKDLDYFVCFSSVTSGRGNAGQTNYGFANSVMERICEIRRKDGIPGLAIQWGAIGDVGVVAESLGGNDVIIGGTIPQRIPSCMEVLDSFLCQKNYATLSSIVKADKKRGSIGAKGDLLRQVCHILGVKDPSSLDPNTTLGDLGLDSLMAVEIRQGLERDYDMVLSAQEVRALKIKDIQAIGKQKSKSDHDKEGGGKGEQLANKNSFDEGSIINLKISHQILNYLNETQATGGRPIYILPPLDADFQIISKLAFHIIRPVIGIYWTEEMDHLNTIQDIAKYYALKVKEIYPDSTYDLCGMKFGSLIAFEMAVYLQSQMGNKAITKLLFLDGAPSYLKKLYEPCSTFMTVEDEDERHREGLLCFLKYYFSSKDLSEIQETLKTQETREERIASLASYLTSLSKKEVPANLLATATERFFKKIRMLYNYKPTTKFVGEVRLIRPITCGRTGLPIDGLPNDYGLSEIVEGPCDVRKVDGDHDTFTDKPEELGTMIDIHFQYLTFA